MRLAFIEESAMSVRKQVRRNPKTEKRREKWYVDINFEHADGRVERVRKDAPIQTKRDAEQYERQLRFALQNGTYKKEEPKPTPKFAEFAEEFVSTYAVNNNKKSEVATKRTNLKNHLIPFFGAFRLDSIGSREIERFKSVKLKEGYNPKTINNYLTLLRKLLVVAVEYELLKVVPPVKWLRVPPAGFDFLTFDEAARLLAAAEPEWRTMILVALRTGLRQGELLALSWDDVDLVAGRLVVSRNLSHGEITTPKNGKAREIPLGDEVLAALKRHRHLRGELVFCKEDGNMLTKGCCKHPLRRALKRAGLRHIGWHALRHTFASHLVMRKAPIKAVQELMGHGTVTMTERYAHLSPDVRKDAVRLLDSYVNTASMGTVEVVK
jgi:integrase